MKKRMLCGWFAAALAAWTLHAAAEQPKLTAIEVTSTPKTNVTVRGKGVAGTAYQLRWSAKLGDAADWKPAGDATAKDDGTFAILDEGFRKPGFYRVQGGPSGRWLVVDLSGGPSAASWPVEELTAAPAQWTDEYKTTKLVLRKVEAGTFTMGSPESELGRSDGETPHTVTLSKPYYLGVFEVTQKQWELATGARPSFFTNAAAWATRPVESVTYRDIRGTSAGTNWPASSDVDAGSFLGILRAKTGLDFDLPTEAQWEYACRAGTATALNSGKDLTDEDTCPNLAELARYSRNGGNPSTASSAATAGTAKVGSYLPNAWGLYDMHGNVTEWCLDWKGAYPASSVADPAGAETGTYRTGRGGDYSHLAGDCRSATRGGYRPTSKGSNIGLRLACPDTPIDAVQLWADGPKWAKKNLGAESPEDYGLYFWWGDTLGYRREGDAWVSCDDTVTNFSFTRGNTPTYGKDAMTLINECWTRDDSILAPDHDAARAHWGEEWRMPTRSELAALDENCDWTLTTQNGVYGYVVSGRGDYAARSIFLPAAGHGSYTSLDNAGWGAEFWSSVPDGDNSWGLSFYLGDKGMNSLPRYYGRSIRPVRDPGE